jgi:hypothetical protein
MPGWVFRCGSNGLGMYRDDRPLHSNEGGPAATTTAASTVLPHPHDPWPAEREPSSTGVGGDGAQPKQRKRDDEGGFARCRGTNAWTERSSMPKQSTLASASATTGTGAWACGQWKPATPARGNRLRTTPSPALLLM